MLYRETHLFGCLLVCLCVGVCLCVLVDQGESSVLYRETPLFVSGSRGVVRALPRNTLVWLFVCFVCVWCVFGVLVVQGESSVLYRETPMFVSGSRGVVRALPRNTLVCLIWVFGCMLCPEVSFVKFFWRRVLVEYRWSCVA